MMASCSGAPSTPTAPSSAVAPAPTASAPVTLHGRVTEAPPTPTTGIEGAVLTIGDGVNEGKSAITNPFGFYAIAGVQPGVFTMKVTADGYVSHAHGVEVAADNPTSNFQLLPTPAMMTDTVGGDIAATDGTCSDGTASKPCNIVMVPIHNAGAVEAVLTWMSPNVDLDLTLFQTGVALPISRSASSGAAEERVSAELKMGATYEFRITYSAGANRTAYTLRITHLN
jgi:hypothetical protein